MTTQISAGVRYRPEDVPTNTSDEPPADPAVKSRRPANKARGAVNKASGEPDKA